MKKILAGLISAALVCTAIPVYAAEESEDSSSLPETVCLEESEAGEDIPDSEGWSILEEQAQIPMTMAASSSGSVVVVLDPGHDSTHTGAQYGGLSEENLNLKIAQYCKEELEQYQGVKVYMTRTTTACPYPGQSNSNDLANRVSYAASVGATVYVSLHLNANSNTSATGAQVYCPNTHYNASVSTEGFALADKIMAQLTALGLENRGVYSVDSQSGTTYPDGSLADYYAVIRRSKLAGFPGIIVEHAFMSNTSDLNNYLSSEASLKKLGVADATGIANYYNLSKYNVQKRNGVWTYVVDGTPDYTYTGVAQNENGWWYIKNGVVDFTYTGFATNQNGKWYIENGKVNFNVNSVIKDTNGALGTKGTWYYVVGGKVQTSFTGLANYKNANGWWYIVNGAVDFTANTVAKNNNGWYYVNGGKVIFSYNGFGKNKNGSWYCEGGKVKFDKNSVIKDTAGALGTKGTWYYVVESKVQTSFTGLANYRNTNGWWYIKKGAVDFTANTIAKNKNGWWYITGGKVILSYNGFGENGNGKWYCEGGKVKFDKNSVLKDTTGAIGTKGTWYYVVKSKVQTGYTGVADYWNENGWWYIKDGAVDFTANTVAKNKNGWWYVENGKVDLSYTGFGENDNGSWYLVGGKVTFSDTGIMEDAGGVLGEKGEQYYVVNSKVQTGFTGEVTIDKETYQIEKGKVVEA